MKSFVPDPKMFTLSGVFYPTGYVFAMFPTVEDARDGERRLVHAGCEEQTLSLLTPADIHEKIAAGFEHEGALPSPGTEAATARHYEELALKGHYALLIPASKQEDAEKVMQALRGARISFAQRYRHLVIEDLVA